MVEYFVVEWFDRDDEHEEVVFRPDEAEKANKKFEELKNSNTRIHDIRLTKVLRFASVGF